MSKGALSLYTDETCFAHKIITEPQRSAVASTHNSTIPHTQLRQNPVTNTDKQWKPSGQKWHCNTGPQQNSTESVCSGMLSCHVNNTWRWATGQKIPTAQCADFLFVFCINGWLNNGHNDRFFIVNSNWPWFLILSSVATKKVLPSAWTFCVAKETKVQRAKNKMEKQDSGRQRQ